MRWFQFTIFLVFCTVLNACNLLNDISLFDARPDLLLILLFFFTVKCETFDAMIISFAIGFAADISSTTMGPGIITFGIVGSAMSHISQIVAMKKKFHQGIVIFITALIVNSFVVLLAFFKIKQGPSSLFAAIVGSACYSAFVGPFLWSVLSAIAPWLGLLRPRLGRHARR